MTIRRSIYFVNILEVGNAGMRRAIRESVCVCFVYIESYYEVEDARAPLLI